VSESFAKFEFGRVDEAADPKSFIDYLDTVGRAVEQFRRLGDQALVVREGQRILDVGCGTGDDTRRLARLVGSSGHVIGIDSSEAMIEEARQRAHGSSLPVEYRIGDAHRLELPDSTFDAVRAERVFQHLASPMQALAELVRVTRPGGRVVIGPDPEWESLVIGCSDSHLMRRIKTACCDALASGRISHENPVLMGALGFGDVSVTPGTLVLRTLGAAEVMLELSRVAERARDRGVISGTEYSSWTADLRARDEAGDFFLALTGFLTSGRKQRTGPEEPGR
jgi:SAM-dependent methyltransferase